MVRCCARRRGDDSSDDDRAPLRRRDYDDYDAIAVARWARLIRRWRWRRVARWARLFRLWRRVARLKRIWAFLGHRLREIKDGG